MATTVGLVVLGLIVAIALLLSSERGRTVLKVLLIVPALLLVVALLTLFSYRAASFARHQAEVKTLVEQRSDVRRAEVREALVEASAHFDEAIARLEESDPQVQNALAAASRCLHGTQPLLSGPGSDVDKAVADVQARIQEQLSRIDHPDPKVREAFAKASARIEEMRAKLEAMRPGRPASHAAVALAQTKEIAKPPEKTDQSVEEEAPAAETAKQELVEEKTAPAEDRPEWVDATPRKLGSVYQMSVKVLYADQEELDREYPSALQAGIDEYLMEHLREPRARGRIELPLDYVKSEIVHDQWEETLQVRITPEGQTPEEYVPMTQRYVLLQFDHAVNARIEEEWDKVVVTERLFGVGSLAGMVLMLLAGVYAYLKIDLATGGAYRGRLRLAAAAVLLIAILAGLALSAA